MHAEHSVAIARANQYPAGNPSFFKSYESVWVAQYRPRDGSCTAEAYAKMFTKNNAQYFSESKASVDRYLCQITTGMCPQDVTLYNGSARYSPVKDMLLATKPAHLRCVDTKKKGETQVVRGALAHPQLTGYAARKKWCFNGSRIGCQNRWMSDCAIKLAIISHVLRDARAKAGPDEYLKFYFFDDDPDGYHPYYDSKVSQGGESSAAAAFFGFEIDRASTPGDFPPKYASVIAQKKARGNKTYDNSKNPQQSFFAYIYKSIDRRLLKNAELTFVKADWYLDLHDPKLTPDLPSHFTMRHTDNSASPSSGRVIMVFDYDGCSDLFMQQYLTEKDLAAARIQMAFRSSQGSQSAAEEDEEKTASRQQQGRSAAENDEKRRAVLQDKPPCHATDLLCASLLADVTQSDRAGGILASLKW